LRIFDGRIIDAVDPNVCAPAARKFGPEERLYCFAILFLRSGPVAYFRALPGDPMAFSASDLLLRRLSSGVEAKTPHGLLARSAVCAKGDGPANRRAMGGETGAPAP
jgi:hypothetical protein